MWDGKKGILGLGDFYAAGDDKRYIIIAMMILKKVVRRNCVVFCLRG